MTGLADSTQADDLSQYFEKVGVVDTCVLLPDSDQAFVVFKQDRDADRAVRDLHERKYNKMC